MQAFGKYAKISTIKVAKIVNLWYNKIYYKHLSEVLIYDAVKGLGQSVKAEIVVPCDEQDECWAEEWRTRYYKVIEKADAAPALPLEYTDLCDKTEDFYDAADRYMMTVCDMVIAITAGEEEPEALVYARDKGKPIMYIDADTLEIRQ